MPSHLKEYERIASLNINIFLSIMLVDIKFKIKSLKCFRISVASTSLVYSDLDYHISLRPNR